MKKVNSIAEAEELARELEDRFGPLVEPVNYLLQLAKLKVYSSKLAINKIKEKDKIIIKFSTDHSLSSEKILDLGSQFEQVRFSAEEPPTIKVISQNMDDDSKLDLLMRLLKFLCS